MQGKISNIDIRSLLQLIELGQRTGELLIEPLSVSSSKQQDSEFWFLFFNQGKIAYAADSSHGSLTRLQDYLRRYNLNEQINCLLKETPLISSTVEYDFLWLILEHRLISPNKARRILQCMIEETLFDLLALYQGEFVFSNSSPLAPQLSTWSTSTLISSVTQQVQQWKQFHPYIQLSSQCPVIKDEVQLQAASPEKTYKSLQKWADGKTSLRQIARFLNRPLLPVAKAIYPYIQQGWIQLLDNPTPKRPLSLSGRESSSHVIYIDDDLSLTQSIEQLLQQQGYQTTTIADSTEALSLCFRLQPDLIVCDLAMPKLDGYDLCAMLRQSKAFRHTPILMLTGALGLIDRVKARMAGATDYLAQPFENSELITLIEKYIGKGTYSHFSVNLEIKRTIARDSVVRVANE